MLPHSDFLQQTVLIFGAALAVASLFRRLRAPAVIGFLVTGLLIGQSGLRLIPHDAVGQFAEIGLVLLLFTVGLELSPEPLLRAGARVCGAALIQMLATTLIAAVLLRLCTSLSFPAALTIGIALSLSSTAIVLKQLGDLRRTDSPSGTIITGILLLQDVLVILVMMLLPLIAGRGGSFSSAAGRGLLAVGGLVVVTILARRAIPFVLRAIVGVGGRELATLLAVLMACAGAYLAGLAGWSWALGACIAGLLLAETDLRHQLFADILPFRDVFNALFFISMGMLVDLPAAADHLTIIALAVVAVLVTKALIAALAVGGVGWPVRLSVQVGMGLCTVSEFAYVLLKDADKLALLPEGSLNVLNALTVGTMIVGAACIPLSDSFSLWMASVIWRRTPVREESDSAPTTAGRHVIIVGYGLNGRNLARVLAATKIDFVVVEMNLTLAAAARRDGARVIVGDAAQAPILRTAGLAAARALVIAIHDQQATRRIVAQAHAARSDLFILARTRFVTEVDVLYRLGARQVIPEEFETSIEIFTRVLHEFRIPTNVVEAQIAMIRSARYGMLRGLSGTSDQRMELLQYLDATATQTFLLPAESPACGRTIRDTELRAKTGTTIIAVVRNGKPTTNPTPDLRLEAGDVLVLVGAHGQLDNAKALLTPPGGEHWRRRAPPIRAMP